MGFVDVKNKPGADGKPPPPGYASWLDFWQSKKGKKAGKCQVMLCGGKPDIGGHLVKTGEGGKTYILPMCHACNSRLGTEALRAWDADLIPIRSPEPGLGGPWRPAPPAPD